MTTQNILKKYPEYSTDYSDFEKDTLCKVFILRAMVIVLGALIMVAVAYMQYYKIYGCKLV